MKVFTTAEVRQLLDSYKREEISFSKMVELLNKKADMNRIAEDIMEKERSILPDYDFTVPLKAEASYKIKGKVVKDNTPAHYDNSKGSLYKFAEDQKLNSWEFDILKRVIRCRKKGQFLEDINKTIAVLELYKKEYKQDFFCNDEAVQKAQDLGEPIERCSEFCGNNETCVE